MGPPCSNCTSVGMGRSPSVRHHSEPISALAHGIPGGLMGSAGLLLTRTNQLPGERKEVHAQIGPAKEATAAVQARGCPTLVSLCPYTPISPCSYAPVSLCPTPLSVHAPVPPYLYTVPILIF